MAYITLMIVIIFLAYLPSGLFQSADKLKNKSSYVNAASYKTEKDMMDFKESILAMEKNREQYMDYAKQELKEMQSRIVDYIKAKTKPIHVQIEPTDMDAEFSFLQSMNSLVNSVHILSGIGSAVLVVMMFLSFLLLLIYKKLTHGNDGNNQTPESSPLVPISSKNISSDVDVPIDEYDETDGDIDSLLQKEGVRKRCTDVSP